MSAAIGRPEHDVTSNPPVSFYVACQSCHQIALFASPEGAILCDWRIELQSPTLRNGLRVLAGLCRWCFNMRRQRVGPAKRPIGGPKR